MSRKKRIILISSFCLLGVFIMSLVIATGIYLGTYYHAEDEAVDAFLDNSQIETIEIEDGTVAFVPRIAGAGFIFYPGGKVEAKAYYPLMEECAKKGILSVIV